MTVWILAGLVSLLAVRAVARCRREIRAERAEVRRRADAVDQLGRARARWDRGTRILEEGLRPLLDSRPLGFGDSEVALARWRAAAAEAELVEER
jgi:hypothetical protein